jgi:hypothetical protein
VELHGYVLFKSVFELKANLCILLNWNPFYLLEFIPKVKMSRRTTSAYRNVNYQELQKDDDEFIDTQVGIYYALV